jgi:hypothetical protein
VTRSERVLGKEEKGSSGGRESASERESDNE